MKKKWLPIETFFRLGTAYFKGGRCDAIGPSAFKESIHEQSTRIKGRFPLEEIIKVHQEQIIKQLLPLLLLDFPSVYIEESENI
jgi:hypothetical protein